MSRTIPSPRNPRPATESDRPPGVRRPPKFAIPPDIIAGNTAGARAAISRQARLRFAAPYLPPTRNHKASKNFRQPHQWKTIEITIPRAVAEVAGFEPGMTIQMEAYVGGWVRMYAAGDVLSREEENV